MATGLLKRWHILKIKFLWQLPGDARKKIKKLLKLGDQYSAISEQKLANYCYELARELAEKTDAIHLLKKINQRLH